MSGLFHPIDIYCERTTAHLTAEPLNALSNISFFVAAYFLAKTLKRVPDQPISFYWLALLVLAIGIGSSAFHIFANRLTMLMDVIPIGLFLLSAIWIFMRDVARQPRYLAALSIIGFVFLGSLTGKVPEAYSLNGSISYLPALIYLVIMVMIAGRLRLEQTAHLLRRAVLIFIFSMTMRSIDMWVCEHFPIGTHFLWHLCNGYVLYLVVKAMMIGVTSKEMQPKPASTPHA